MKFEIFTAVLILISVPVLADAQSVTIPELNIPSVNVDENGVRVGDTVIDKNGVRNGSVVVSGQPANGTATDGAGSNSDVGYGKVFPQSNYARANYAGQDLAGAVFQGGNFSRATFSGANLEGALFEHANFSRARFNGACLEGAVFRGSNFSRADFSNAILTGSVDEGSNFSRAVQINTDRSSHCGKRVHAARARAVESRVDLITASEIQLALAAGVDSRVDLTINFETDSDNVVGKAHEQLYEIAVSLRSESLSKTRILIEGHTDSVGSESYNEDLSYRRALRIKRVLVEKYGIDRSRLEIVGYGESRPITSNDTELGRALNRRVTLVNRG